MNIVELSRLLANLIKKGEVCEVDPAQAVVRVRCGDLVTDWLPYFVSAAGAVAVHRPPSVGEIALLLAPSGELADALVVCGWSGKTFPNPATDSQTTKIKFADGAACTYNHNNGMMTINGVQDVVIQASNQIILQTPEVICTDQMIVQGLLTYKAGLSGSGGGAGTSITGPINHQGDLTNSGSVSSNGINLSTHIHGGVQAGGSQTGVPA